MEECPGAERHSDSQLWNIALSAREAERAVLTSCSFWLSGGGALVFCRSLARSLARSLFVWSTASALPMSPIWCTEARRAIRFQLESFEWSDFNSKWSRIRLRSFWIDFQFHPHFQHASSVAYVRFVRFHFLTTSFKNPLHTDSDIDEVTLAIVPPSLAQGPVVEAFSRNGGKAMIYNYTQYAWDVHYTL